MGDMPIGTSAPLPEAIAEYLAACEAEGQSRATLGWKRAVLRRFAHYADSVAAGDVGALTLKLARRWQRHLRTAPMARPRRKPGHEGERRAAHTVPFLVGWRVTEILGVGCTREYPGTAVPHGCEAAMAALAGRD